MDKNLPAHVFVYECFHGVDTSRKWDIDHINGIKDDNRVGNLQRLTRKDHVQKTFDDHPGLRGRMSLGRRRPILRTERDGSHTWFACAEEAANATEGASRKCVSACAIDNRKTHAGYMFSFAPISAIDGEEWRVISSGPWTGVHVSNIGRVKTSQMGRLLSINMHHGYQHVHVGRRRPGVHQLVCHAFHGPPPSEHHTVDHINRDRADNKHFNLRWATRALQNANRVYGEYCKSPLAPVSGMLFDTKAVLL